MLDTYVGEYELAPAFHMVVTRVKHTLYVQATGQNRLTLLARSDRLPARGLGAAPARSEAESALSAGPGDHFLSSALRVTPRPAETYLDAGR